VPVEPKPAEKDASCGCKTSGEERGKCSGGWIGGRFAPWELVRAPEVLIEHRRLGLSIERRHRGLNLCTD